MPTRLSAALSLGLWLVLSSPLSATSVATGSCPPASHDRTALDALKAGGFKIDDAAARQALALDLVQCLAHPDPAIRDGLAFEAYYTWMREGLLDDNTLGRLRDALVERIQRPRTAADPGFEVPFAVLVLAEVVRTDRIKPWMDAPQRQALLDLGTGFLKGVTDLRGFDAREGWRHGVAHGADLVLQLSVHPQIGGAAQRQLLAAIATQVQPHASATHFYIYGEPERLARSFIVIAGRDDVPATELADWLSAVAAPGPVQAWGEAYKTQEGLARRHNVGLFLKSVLAALPEQPRYADLAKRVRELLGGM